MDITGITNNEPFIGLLMTGCVGLGGLIVALLKNFWNKRYEESISRLYPVMEKYFNSVNKLKNNIDIMPLEYLQKKNGAKLDELIDAPTRDFVARTLMLEMFLKKKDRKCIQDLLDAVIKFNIDLHNAFNGTDFHNKYGIFKQEFNEAYKLHMKEFVEVFHTRLLGKWYWIF